MEKVMKKYFMGIDVGTTESKGVLTDEMCRVIASAATEHDLENPKPNYFEHDAEKVWWGDFCKLSHLLLKESGVSSEDIAGIGVSALSADVVPVDENCVPLRKAILYGIDARAKKEIEEITAYYGEKRLKELLNGRELCSSDCMPKILWIKNNEPDIYKKTYKFLTASSYLTAKLTGKYVIDRYLAISSFAPCYGKSLTVDKELTEELYCRWDQLAEGRETQDVVGTVTAEAAAETGLSEGTPVVAGTDDSGAEAISTGVLSPGDTMVQLGSTCYIICCSDRMIPDERIWTEDYLVPGTYCLDGGTNTAGSLTKWVRDIYYPDYVEEERNGGENAYSRMSESVNYIKAGSDGVIVLPYFAGERTPINDDQAKGVVMGLLLNHTRDHICNAVLESVGYSINQHMKIFEEHGVKIRNLYCAGGGTKNAKWLQIIADITGKPVKVAKETMGASYGDAMIAAIGTGHIENFDKLSDYIQISKIYEPDRERFQIYQKYQKLYEKLYAATKEIMHELP